MLFFGARKPVMHDEFSPIHLALPDFEAEVKRLAYGRLSGQIDNLEIPRARILFSISF